MTDLQPLQGQVDNGAQGIADFPFYAGPVGIRQRDGWIDVAFFSSPMRLRGLPLLGKLDGADVTITAIRARDMNGDTPLKPSDRAPRVIVATVIPIA